MGLLVEEIMELRELKAKFNQGNASIDKVQANVALFSQMEKREKMILTALMCMAKNRHMIPMVLKSNLIEQDESLEIITDRGMEKIQCSELGKTITRAECLDYSGDHSEACQRCPEKKKTNDLLLENKSMTA